MGFMGRMGIMVRAFGRRLSGSHDSHSSHDSHGFRFPMGLMGRTGIMVRTLGLWFSGSHHSHSSHKSHGFLQSVGWGRMAGFTGRHWAGDSCEEWELWFACFRLRWRSRISNARGLNKTRVEENIAGRFALGCLEKNPLGMESQRWQSR